MRLLLVEDDAQIAGGIQRGFYSAGFDVDVATNGADGLDWALKTAYSVIVLDLMLPLMNGLEICERLRSSGVSVPILMLTAKDTVLDRVRGLETGADDYLVKPFAFPELLARVKALIRRDKIHRGKAIKIGQVNLDVQQRRVLVEGEEVSLNPREFELLEALMLNEGRVLTRDTIQFRVWQGEDSYSNVVDVQIRRLRLKIERPNLPKLIHTIQGVGYSLRRPDEEVP